MHPRAHHKFCVAFLMHQSLAAWTCVLLQAAGLVNHSIPVLPQHAPSQLELWHATEIELSPFQAMVQQEAPTCVSVSGMTQLSVASGNLAVPGCLQGLVSVDPGIVVLSEDFWWSKCNWAQGSL
jgi:hypothetical protein